MKLRYYADPDIREWRDQALRLLTTIHTDHGIPVEVDQIDDQHGPISEFPGEVRFSTPKEVYERDLKRNQHLNSVIKQTPSEAYKHYGEFDIAGNVAVVDGDGTVQWASTLSGYADEYPPGAESETALDFLEELATSPSNRICVECLAMLGGTENFCPKCGHSLP